MDEQEYNRIKNEYKEHFRKMRDLKKRVGEVERKQRLGDALESLNTSAIMDSFNHLVDQVKEKAAVSQAKIELMLEQDEGNENDFRAEEELRKEEARKLINDLKQSTETAEVTSTQTETHSKKDGQQDSSEKHTASTASEIKKTIGPRK